jgi:hypothetical protein
MAGEYEDSNETLNPSSPPPTGGSFLTLQKAIEFGTYEPDELSIFPEWHQLTRPAQYQLVKQGVDNRLRQLIQQWAEINNVLDFRLKPHLQEALDKIMEQRKKVLEDKERLMVEFSGG